jgi:hypothetical protein
MRIEDKEAKNMVLPLTHHREPTEIQDVSLKEQLIRKLNRDIQESTGLDVIDKKITLHEFEKKYKITIKAPKRNVHGKLGYHRHKTYAFISPIERERINKVFDDEFGIETGEFEFLSESD